jgi:hypothetical protein
MYASQWIYLKKNEKYFRIPINQHITSTSWNTSCNCAKDTVTNFEILLPTLHNSLIYVAQHKWHFHPYTSCDFYWSRIPFTRCSSCRWRAEIESTDLGELFWIIGQLSSQTGSHHTTRTIALSQIPHFECEISFYRINEPPTKMGGSV